MTSVRRTALAALVSATSVVAAVVAGRFACTGCGGLSGSLEHRSHPQRGGAGRRFRQWAVVAGGGFAQRHLGGWR